VFSTLNSFLIFLGAAAFWTLIGLPFARRVLPGPLAAFAAPALGWALHSALVLPIHWLIGFTPFSVLAVSLAAMAGAIVFLWTAPRVQTPHLPVFLIGATLAAIAISLCVAIAIAPKFDGEAVLLSPAIFDHSKVAMVDEMARLGVPPGNSFFGGPSVTGPLAYYYLWHFSAAELVLAGGINSWEADAALTAFSAYSSLMLMMGLSVWFGGRASAAYWVPMLALAGSLRPVLEFLTGKTALYSFMWPPTGFAGWFFQATWVPQHIASATCVVIAIILLAELARKPSPLLLLTFVLTVVAGYESSTWVGGITFAFGATATGIVLLGRIPPSDRPRFIAWSIAGAFLALALAAPFLVGQSVISSARGVGLLPIALHHYDVLGEFFTEPLRRVLDWPAYWLIFLVIEFPAIYPAGLIVLIAMLQSKITDAGRQAMVLALAALTMASLMTAWLLVSTLGENNDLGWRAVLPAIMILTALTACGLAHWVAARAMLAAALALAALTLGLPDGVLNLRDNVLGRPNRSGIAFSQQSSLWASVREHAAPADRIGNNPLSFQDMTPWPVNIAWALLSNRRSCFAGNELTLAYTLLTKSQREAFDAQFIRLFAGTGSPADVRDAAERYACRVIVVTVLDGAWTNDPFSNSPYYRLAEERAGAWRIYRATGAK
jgi:hypothetical protein